MPFLRRIPIRFTANERHFHPYSYKIYYTKNRRGVQFPRPEKKEKSTRTSPSAFPTVLRRCRSRWDRRTAVRRIKFPIKVRLCRTFIPLPRDTCPEPPLPCRGEGVIAPGFFGTGGVSKGDRVPLRTHLRGGAASDTGKRSLASSAAPRSPRVLRPSDGNSRAFPARR